MSHTEALMTTSKSGMCLGRAFYQFSSVFDKKILNRNWTVPVSAEPVMELKLDQRRSFGLFG